MMLTVYFIDRYTYKRSEHKSCNYNRYNNRRNRANNRYNTVAEAKEACNLDPGCQSVYDGDCDESRNDVYLCPVGTTYSVSSSSCIFQKGNI